MQKQPTLNDVPALQETITALLALLDPGGEMGTTLLRRYTQWADISQVPFGNLLRLRADIHSETKAHEAMQEDIYFNTITAADKIQLYRAALEQMPAELAKEGRGLTDGITFAEFRRALNQCILVARPAPPPKRRKPQKSGKKKKPLAKRKAKPFVPPTFDEVVEYAKQRGNKVDPQAFWDYFTCDPAHAWIDKNGTPVKSWKMKLITWETKGGHETPRQSGTAGYGRNAVPQGAAAEGDLLASAEPYTPIFTQKEAQNEN